MVAGTMSETTINPIHLPLQTAAPGAGSRAFTETLQTPLAPESVWSEFLRALENSEQAVLWSHEVSSVQALLPLGPGAVLAERLKRNGVMLYYRVLRFEPLRQLEYASLQGHPMAGGATVSVERSEGTTYLRWQVEYRGSEEALNALDHFRAAFFPKLARQLKQLEATAPLT